MEQTGKGRENVQESECTPGREVYSAKFCKERLFPKVQLLALLQATLT